MLVENKLFIDRDCPMCSIYGNGFTKLGLIDDQTLCQYQNMESVYTEVIDIERAKDEIALHDTLTQTTTYGIDSLIKILGHNRVWLQKLLKFPLVYALLLRLYRFISYNRKVIYPTAPNKQGMACTPSVNLKYRWIYLIFTALFTGVILNQFAFHLNASVGLPHYWSREYLVCFGQIAWQLLAIQLIDKEKALEYLGNMSTVSLIGGLLLLPVLLINSFFPLGTLGLLGAFGLVVGVMFLEHIRRCYLLNVSLKMTASWILYRMVVLVFILLTIWEYLV